MNYLPLRGKSLLPKWSIWVIIVMLTIGIIVFGWWLYPQVMGLYFQVRGGRLLGEAIQIAPDIDPDNILCAVDPSKDEVTRGLALEATDLLKRAIEYDPSLSQAHLQLGDAFCLLGDPENAVEPYLTFVRLRPENPLGHLKLGIAYATPCYSLSKYQSGYPLQPKCDEELLERITSELKQANIDPAHYLNYADDEYKQQRWGEAFLFYALEENVNQPLSSEARFRRDIIEITNKKKQEIQIDSKSLLSIQLLTNRLTIEANSLQGSFDSTPLSQNPGGDPSIGIMWWNGDAITGVQVLDGGEYELTLLAQNIPPIPIQFQLLVDFKPVVTFELSRGDMSWQEFSTIIVLEAGIHTIGVRYLNNDLVDGLDRNLYMKWLKIN